MGFDIDFPDKNGFVIENGVLKKYEGDEWEITIPDSVEEIGNSAFAHCDSLRSITIPGSVKEIGEDAFKYCDSLRTIYVNNEETVDVILENNPEIEDKIVMFR